MIIQCITSANEKIPRLNLTAETDSDRDTLNRVRVELDKAFADLDCDQDHVPYYRRLRRGDDKTQHLSVGLRKGVLFQEVQL